MSKTLRDFSSDAYDWAYEADLIKSRNPESVSIHEAVNNSMPNWTDRMTDRCYAALEQEVMEIVRDHYEELRAFYVPEYKKCSGSEAYLALVDNKN